jgi:hypothetical protein
MARRRTASNWIVPGLVAVATFAALSLAKAEFGKAAAIGLALASLVYVATVVFMRCRKVH